MKSKELLERAQRLAARSRVTDGSTFKLKNIDPNDLAWLSEEQKPEAEQALREGIEALSDLQERLYAQDRWALLLLFQAMDAAGKDGVIKHVMSGVNPQGCEVYAFKAPTSEDLDHDYLWRCMKRLPERGRIGIFNRSYYEETLVVRVHPELLAKQKLPPTLVTKKIWDERFEDIRHFEKYLTRNGIVVLKFFLHVSKHEQLKRFLKRLDEPTKNWKFSEADVQERQHWEAYMDAYEEVIRNTATPEAPWYVVPADNKWFTRIVVAAAIIDALVSLNLTFPQIDDTKRAELALVREHLLKQG